MEFTICSFGFILIVSLGQVMARSAGTLDAPSAGLLNEMPANCAASEFCLEKHEKYPQDVIDELLLNKYQLSLGDVHEDTGHRQGEGEDSNDCEKEINYGEIYEILDSEDNVRVVVQSPKHFKQQIRIERCMNPGRLLLPEGTEHFPSEELENNKIFCVEKKINFSFLVLTKDGHGVEAVRSKTGIPVCCSCRVET